MTSERRAVHDPRPLTWRPRRDQSTAPGNDEADEKETVDTICLPRRQAVARLDLHALFPAERHDPALSRGSLRHRPARDAGRQFTVQAGALGPTPGTRHDFRLLQGRYQQVVRKHGLVAAPVPHGDSMTRIDLPLGHLADSPWMRLTITDHAGVYTPGVLLSGTRLPVMAVPHPRHLDPDSGLCDAANELDQKF